MKKIIDFIKKYWKLILSIIGLAGGAVIAKGLLNDNNDSLIKDHIDKQSKEQLDIIEKANKERIKHIAEESELRRQLNDHLSTKELNDKLDSETKKNVDTAVDTAVDTIMDKVSKASRKNKV